MLVDARSSIAFGLVFFIPLLLLILPMLVLVHHLHSSPLLWTLGLALYRTSTSLDERAVDNLKSGASGNAAAGVGRGWWWAIWFRGAGREVPRSCQQNRKRATLPSLSQRARSRYWSPRFLPFFFAFSWRSGSHDMLTLSGVRRSTALSKRTAPRLIPPPHTHTRTPKPLRSRTNNDSLVLLRDFRWILVPDAEKNKSTVRYKRERERRKAPPRMRRYLDEVRARRIDGLLWFGAARCGAAR